MRIAVFHELPVGGALTVVHEMTKRLKKLNQVDLYTTFPTSKYNGSDYFSNVYTYPFHAKKWTGGNWKIRLYKDSIELLNLFFLHKKIAKDILERKYDILLVNASVYIEAPFILRFPNKNKVFYCHDSNYRLVYELLLQKIKNIDKMRSVYERLNRFIRKSLDLKNITSSDSLIASSMFEHNIIKKTYKLPSTIIQYGIDTKFFKPADIKKEYDLLFLGTTHELEGYPTLLKILKLLPKHIKPKIILGDIEYISDRKELLSLYQKSKIVLSLSKNEPFGLTPLEAMACGVPVIAVNEGGYKETVKNDYNGFLVKRDPKILTSKILQLLSDQKLYKQLSINGRNDALNNWKWETNIEKLTKLFQSLINKSGK